MFQLLSLKVMYPSPDKDGAACLILWGCKKASHRFTAVRLSRATLNA
ncbi:hypothetical protein [Nostoc sp.]